MVQRTSSRLLMILLLVGLAIPLGAQAFTDPGSDVALDLAAMVPHPSDLLGGLAQGDGSLHSDLVPTVHDPFFGPALRVEGLTERTVNLLRGSGWRRTYTNIVGLFTPPGSNDYGLAIRFSIAEFRDTAGAGAAYAGFSELLRDEGATLESIFLDGGVSATLSSDTWREAPDATLHQIVLFPVRHLLAQVVFSNYVDEPFQRDEVISISSLFHDRIENGLAQTGATLGGQALRLRSEHGVPLTTEWFLRRDGREVPALIDPGGERQQRAYGEATDVYSVLQTVEVGTREVRLLTFLFRFPSDTDAAAWLPLWQRLVVEVYGWELSQAQPTVVAADHQVVLSALEDLAGNPEHYTVLAGSGRYGIAIELSGSHPASIAAAIAERQLNCFRSNTACDPFPLSLPNIPAIPTPQASPAAETTA